MYRVVSLLIGYVFGMFQTAYFVGRLNGIDIRDHGSKNAGFTNTNRVLGRKMGIIVFVADVLKAVLAFFIANAIFWIFFADGQSNSATIAIDMYNSLPGLYGGLGAVLGHVFPFYLKFKGGKGVSCALGVILMLDWRVALIAFTLGAIAVAITKYISVASMLITASVPFLLAVFWGVDRANFPYALPFNGETIRLTALLAVFVWWLHRANISRLRKGQENKFSFKKNQKEKTTNDQP